MRQFLAAASILATGCSHASPGRVPPPVPPPADQAVAAPAAPANSAASAPAGPTLAPAIAPPTFRPALADAQILLAGNVLVLAKAVYRGIAGYDDHVPDYWVLPPGAEPCLAHPGPVTTDARLLACSAVDCEWSIATIPLQGCPAATVALPAPPASSGAPRPVPTWRYVAATVTAGSDLEALAPDTADTLRRLARYERRRGRRFQDPHLVRRAAVATEVPAAYRALARTLHCGKRCALSWSVARIELDPPVEAVVISKTDLVGDARCHMRTKTLARLFTITPTGPVPAAADDQPTTPDDPGDTFTGAVVEDQRIVYLTSTSDTDCVPVAR